MLRGSSVARAAAAQPLESATRSVLSLITWTSVGLLGRVDDRSRTSETQDGARNDGVAVTSRFASRGRDVGAMFGLSRHFWQSSG